jgi:hypothetical protein
MTKTTIVQIVTTLFSDLSDALVYYNSSPATDKATILHARDLTRDALTLLETPDEKAKEQSKDSAVLIPGRELKFRCDRVAAIELADWELPDEQRHRVVLEPIIVYFINGFEPTTSKIRAIKSIRTRTNWGLRESKDYVDAIVPKAVSNSL